MKLGPVKSTSDELQPTADEIESSWTCEAEERVRQIDVGEVELLDGEDVMREMRSICR
jgi:hypothetical protein